MISTRTRAFLSVGVVAAVAGLGLSAAALSTLTPAPAPAPALGAGDLEVDSVHSVVVYKIKHAKASNHYGVFFGPTGTFQINASDPAKSSMNISVKLDDLHSGNGKRDQHLKSPDFFSAKEFPTIAFKSTTFKPGAGGKMEVTGDLTLHGVTKPVTAALEVTGTNGGMNGTSTGVEATFTIKRSDFGMKSFLDNGMLGDDVTLTVALEGGVPEAKAK